jgi:hypothetical protein
LLVSLDGPKSIHDQNRGLGNYQKTINFIKHAQKLGFPTEIMFLVTPQTYPLLKTISATFSCDIGRPTTLNYISLKTAPFTDNHPLARPSTNPTLSPQQIIHLKKTYHCLPSRHFGCFQLSLQSNGQVYGCCESPHPLGPQNLPITQIVSRFSQTLDPCRLCPDSSCQGCSDPGFFCGYPKELRRSTCQQVVKLFN